MNPVDKFTPWLKEQLRLAGEELIRRSEELTDTSLLRPFTDLEITLRFPTNTDRIALPEIEINTTSYNKVALDDYFSKHAYGE